MTLEEITPTEESQGQTFKEEQYFKGCLWFYNAGQYIQPTYLKL